MAEETDLLKFRSAKAGAEWREVYGYRPAGKNRWEIIHLESEAHYGFAIGKHHARLFAQALNNDINRIYAQAERERHG